MFRNALLVDQSNMGEPIIQPNRSGRRRLSRKAMDQHRSENKLENTLFYYQSSPTFCERDPSADIQGEAMHEHEHCAILNSLINLFDGK